MKDKRVLMATVLSGVSPSFTLIDDLFTDTLAGGSVDGTDCTPGGGVRKIAADAGNLISVGSGVMAWVGGTGFATAQAYFTKTGGAGISRGSGVVLTVDIKNNSNSGRSILGFTPSTGGIDGLGSVNNEACIYFHSGGTIYSLVNGTATDTTVAYSAGATYRVRITLKTAGCKIEYSSDGGSNYTTIYDDVTGTSAVLYPYCQFINTSKGGTLDNLTVVSPF